jgi:Tfp pilus assembly pilus retraction ATPase PilT
MNEMDLLTKIEGLEKAIAEHKDFATNYESKLKQTKQELVDLNKPELTASQAEAIEMAISQAVEQFDFDNTENYEIDYSLDYEGRVQCEAHEFINGDDLVLNIVTKVCNLFKEVEEPTNDQLNTQTVAEKIV